MSDIAETIVEQIIAFIRGGIEDGVYGPGQRLVVADVAREVGASAGPVREAIRRLSGEGLIEITAHRGASVRIFKSGDIRELFQLREVVEGLGARLAAEHIGLAENRSSFLAVMEEMRGIIDNGGAGFFQHNRRFHALIYGMAGNGHLESWAERMSRPAYQTGAHRLLAAGYERTSAAEHELIAEAILAGDGPGAEQAMRSHIRNSGAVSLGILEARERRRTEPLRPPGSRRSDG